jgi:hypothetical protein
VSDLNDRIRQSLDRQAGWLRAQPDLDALTDRIARRDRRRLRGVFAVAVLAVFAGPALGFIAGRGTSQAGTDVLPGAGGDSVTVEASGPLPTLVPPAPGSDSAVALRADGASTQYRRFPGFQGPLAKAFVREVGGTTIHVYRAAIDSPAPEGPDWWEPPPTCFPNGYVQADVATEDAVGIVSGEVYPELPDGTVAGSLGALGVAEGAPRWVVVAQAPTGAARVRATFPGGDRDEMEPIDGVVVLIGSASLESGDEAEYETTVPLEAFDADGNSLGTGTALNGRVYLFAESADGLVIPSGAAQGADCSKPAELPPPGAEQPADPAAARAEIEGLFGVLFSDMTDEERLARLDDPSGMDQVYEELRTGPFAEQALGSRTILRDVVFLSATRAAVQYENEIPGYQTPAFGERFGDVVLVDGQWKLSRALVCHEVQLAGITCPPPG